MVLVNGKEYSDIEGKNVSKLLDLLGFKLSLVAVEINGEIVPKAEYETTVIKDFDKVEVVSFVGGG